MTARHAGTAMRALLAGIVCLAILAGMLVGHAWPLWNGQIVILRATPVDPRDLFRGEFVRLDTPGTSLTVTTAPAPAPPGAVLVRPVGEWWGQWSDVEKAQGHVVYVQLERADGGPEFQPISISRAPVSDAVNLKGRIRAVSGSALRVDYGLDAFYMQEGTARPVEDAMRGGRTVQMEVAIASSGRARIRNLLIDGTPLPR